MTKQENEIEKKTNIMRKQIYRILSTDIFHFKCIFKNPFAVHYFLGEVNYKF